LTMTAAFSCGLNSICNSCLVFKCQNLPALEILALHLQAVFPIIAQAFSFFPTRRGYFIDFCIVSHCRNKKDP